MNFSPRFITAVVLAASLAWLVPAGHAQQLAERAAGWWMTEPVRLVQTNVSEKDSTLDPRRLVEQAQQLGANALLFNMGGIVAQYPTQVDFHYPSAFLPQGRDLFGDVLTAAHARGMRVVGRFDLSKTQQPVYAAHPEWFFRDAEGEPAVYNGLYSACINGGYYRRHAEVILTEALRRYPVDGLFFNMFGNPSHDYSGRPLGPCHCDACQKGFEGRFGYALPRAANNDYLRFMADSTRDVASALAQLIHRLRPGAAFMTYVQDYTDVIMSESNTSVARPLPMWPYSASDNVDAARNSQPGKMAINLCMSFVDYPWRQVTVPQPEIALRLYQNLAHGGPPALVVVGTMDQEDRRSLVAAQPVFAWHAAHEDLYVGQQNAARILLLKRGGEASYRGFFRLLSEQHLPFAVSTNLELLADSERKFDLVIAPDGAPGELQAYVSRGGRLLAAGPHRLPQETSIGRVAARRPHVQASWRVHDREFFPSLNDTDLLFLDGPYVELQPLDKPLLTLIPPAMFGPPEKVWVDKVETDIPGLVLGDVGRGRVAYIPWDVGGLYYRHGSEGHAGLMADAIDHLLPSGRQLKSTAHPLVEITVMRQPSRNRTLVHLVNLSGHSDTAYHPPISMRQIDVELEGGFTQARAMRAALDLPLMRHERTTQFTLPAFEDYEVVVLQ